MGFAFIPLYMRFLGMEAYGLIGVFVMLQAWFALLDMGLTPTLSREMARFQAGVHSPQSIRDLVRSVEWVYGLIAMVIALSVIVLAPWLATDWLRAEKLSIATVTDALTITGGVIAMRWLAGLYRSAITGLQQLVWLNICTAIFSTLRGLGVVAVLVWISPTIQAFFIYQGVVAALEALVLAIQLRRLLPPPTGQVRFRWQSLRQVWHFAAGMTSITFLSILLTQMDKLLLSKLLPLTEFGYYSLAGVVSGMLYMLVAPVSNAANPRLTQLVALGDAASLAAVYHKFSQMLTLAVVPAALILALLSDHVLLLWTRDVTTTAEVAPLASLLAIGTMLNGLMYAPFTLQLAHGWTRLTLIVTSVSVLILIPAIYVCVSEYGAVAAAVIWVVHNVLTIAFVVPIMHRKLLPSELWNWYRQDVFVPTFAAFTAIGLVRFFSPSPALEKPVESMAVLAVASSLSLAVVIWLLPIGKSQARHFVGLAINYFKGK